MPPAATVTYVITCTCTQHAVSELADGSQRTSVCVVSRVPRFSAHRVFVPQAWPDWQQKSSYVPDFNKLAIQHGGGNSASRLRPIKLPALHGAAVPQPHTPYRRHTRECQKPGADHICCSLVWSLCTRTACDYYAARVRGICDVHRTCARRDAHCTCVLEYPQWCAQSRYRWMMMSSRVWQPSQQRVLQFVRRSRSQPSQRATRQFHAHRSRSNAAPSTSLARACTGAPTVGGRAATHSAARTPLHTGRSLGTQSAAGTRITPLEGVTVVALEQAVVSATVFITALLG